MHRLARRARPVGAVLLIVLSVACGGAGSDAEVAQSEAEMAQSNITELMKTDQQVGSGSEAVAGRQVSVHYTGWLWDAAKPDNIGRQFDSSRGGQPFSLRLGGGQVIKGWDEGIVGMKVGGKRRLTIPPAYGYGAQGFPGAIPPNATLVFDVELLDVK